MKKTPKSKTSPKKTTASGSKAEVFDNRDGRLDDALNFALDTFEAAQLVVFAYKDMARILVNGDMLQNLSELTFGVAKPGFGPTQRKMLTTVFENFYPKDLKWKVNFKGAEFEHEGVPVKLTVINRHFEFFGNPNSLFYKGRQVRVPNEWEKYWKMRNVLK